jgi:NAD(P)-dependent dehydrogenase (short-subunit alcohol dehydrogenase family)
MKNARFGRIVNIASMAGRTGVPDVSHPYAAAKAAMIGLTRRLALEVAPAGITVNAVAPSVVWSPRIAKVHQARLHEILHATPVGRVGDPHDIADAVWYLARPAAGYVTGAVLDINGGRFMA